MNSDEYDDLPEIYQSWADQFNEVKDGAIFTAKIVAVPFALFGLTCIANYFFNKKWNSL